MANFVFTLRDADNEKATRCFQFAKIANDKGHQVDIFLIDDGVFWAMANRDGSIKTTTGDCPSDYIPALVEAGVAVGVCSPCAKGRSLEEADFHATMKLDGGPHLIDMATDAKVFTF